MPTALAEAGPRGMPGAVFGPAKTSESAYAARPIHPPDRDPPPPADRRFDSNHFLGLKFPSGELQGSHDPSGVVFTVSAAPSGMEREYIRDRTLEGQGSTR
ncbi:hypothetical protein [Streptomyces sp. SID3343]|uniref:hypothetical protein n=1 Tax=Streptomyces sp. SID3343 TaxID=2690260 RepID=UPI0019278090|nr:hypothetical protein [Streptomyces sp. SID3343]